MDKELLDAGEKIVDLVQGAVDRGDFANLCKNLESVIDLSVRTNVDAAERIKANVKAKQEADTARRAAKEAEAREAAKKMPSYQKGTVSGEGSAKMMEIGGIILGIGFAGSTIRNLIWAIGSHGLMTLPLILSALLCAGSAYMAVKGWNRLKLIRKFYRYRDIIGNKTVFAITDLALATQTEVGKVKKELKQMIALGYFREGYMDAAETTLILNRSAYDDYLNLQSSRRQMEAENQEVDEAVRKLSPQEREILREGQEYIKYVHECNEKLPGQEITDKLTRLEAVITKIFQTMLHDPSVVGDMKKLMSYYLPTMKKLLDAYVDLENQPAQGQNITSTKKEIEKALDTVNEAFENLLDSFYQDTAWDISSDITVLNTMLQQEGLSGGKDFQQMTM